MRKRDKTILWLTILFHGLAFCAVIAWHPPVWYTNDDFRMMTIVSGAYTGTPNPDMVFMRYPVGLLLAGLYSLTPAIPWYGLLTMACMFVPDCIFCYYLVKKGWEKNTPALGIGLYVLLFVFLLQKSICLPQFTLTSGFPAVGAMVLLLEMPEQNPGKHILLASALAAVSFSVRSKAFYLLVPAMMLILAVRIFRDGRRAGKYLIFCGVTLALCLGVLLVDLAAWSGPEYQAFREFKEQRSRVYDYGGVPNYYDHIAFYTENGISEVTQRAISGRLLDLDETVNAGTLGKIADYSARIRVDSRSLGKGVWEAFCNSLSRWYASKDATVKYGGIFVTALLFASAALSLGKKEPDVIFFALAAGMLLELTYFEFVGRVMVRILDLMLLPMGVVGCLSVLDLAEGRNRYVRKGPALLAACAVFGFLMAGALNMTEDLGSRVDAVAQTTNSKMDALMGYAAANPDGFYFYDAYDFIACSCYVFQTFPEGTVLNQESLGSWNVRAPSYYARNARFGFHTSIEGLTGDGRDVFFVTSSAPKMGMTKTLKDLYNKKLLEVDRIQTAKDILYVYLAVDDD